MSTVLSFNIFSRYDGSGVRQARSDINDFDNSTTKSTNSLNSWSGRISLATQGALAFGPALVPIATAAAGAAAATVAMGASAGAALGIYGLALKSAISSSDELAKHGDKNAQSFVKAHGDMTTAWKKLIAATTSDTLKPAATAVEGITAVIGKLKPILDAMGPVVQKVATDFKNWAQGSGMDKFVQTIVQYGVPALKNLVDAGEKVLSVLGTAFRTLAPEGLKLSEAIDKGAKALKGWADGGGFTRFLDKVHSVAPSVTQFFDDLWKASKKIGDAVAGLSTPSMIFVDLILKLIAHTPVPVLQGMAIAFVAIKTAMQGIAIYEAVGEVFGAGSTIAAIGAALWSGAMTVLIGTMIAFDVSTGVAVGLIALIVIAVAALAFGIYELVTHWAGFSHAMVTAWNATWAAVKSVVMTVWAWMQSTWGNLVDWFQQRWATVSNALIAAWNATWNFVKTTGQAVWTWIKSAWQTAIGGIATAWNTVGNALKTAWSATWNAVKTAASTVWNWFKTGFTTAINFFVSVWTTVSNALKAAWTATWNLLKTTATTIWNSFKTGWQAAVNFFVSIWTTVSNALKTAWTAVWNFLKTNAQTIWNTIKTAWQTFLNFFKSIWTTVSNALKTAWTAVWNVLKTTAQTVWNAIKTAWQTFLNFFTSIWNTVSSALKTAWQAVWDWLKSTAQTVWDAIKQAWQTLTDDIKKIWDTATTIIENAWKTTWDNLKSTAQGIWNDIKGVISDAVNFIIGIINGLIGGWNTVAGVLGLPQIPTIGGGGGGGSSSGVVGAGISAGGTGNSGLSAGASLSGTIGASSGTGPGGVPGFAEGGVLGGYSPGVDSISAMLSPGEGVLVPEAVRALGADFIHGANHFYSGGRAGQKTGHNFESGGVVRRFAAGGLTTGIIPGPIGNAIEGAVGAISGLGNGVAGKLTSGALGALPGVEAAIKAIMGFVGKAQGMGGPLAGMGAKAAEMGMTMVQKIMEKAQSLLASMASKAGGALGGSVKGLSALALKALKAAGLDPSQLANFLKRIQIESSGNPNAINNWDSNAAAGNNSEGLGQITLSNFATYGSGNILNPYDNLVASARYIGAVYGGQVPTGAAYASGTPGATSGWAMVGEQGPEMINFRGGESVMNNAELGSSRASAAGDTTLHMPITVHGNLDKDAVDKLNTQVIPQLRIMLAKGTGSRIG